LAKVGYARVSTSDQSFNLQVDALKSEGCETIFTEIVSGATSNRPVLNEALGTLNSGDILVIWKLDRVGRSLKNLLSLVTTLDERNVALKSLQDPIDTTSAQGRLIFNIFSSLSEFERELIRERTIAGLKAARARGRKGGRKKGLSPKARAMAIAAKFLHQENRLSINEIVEKLDISRATLYRYLKLDLS